MLEIDASGRHRMLADYSRGRHTMLRLGEKRIVPGYTKAMYLADMTAPVPHELYRPNIVGAIPRLSTDEFFSVASRPTHDRMTSPTTKPGSTSWTRCRARRRAVASSILVGSLRTYRNSPCSDPSPGTGKTAILLNLLVEPDS